MIIPIAVSMVCFLLKATTVLISCYICRTFSIEFSKLNFFLCFNIHLHFDNFSLINIVQSTVILHFILSDTLKLKIWQLNRSSFLSYSSMQLWALFCASKYKMVSFLIETLRLFKMK